MLGFSLISIGFILLVLVFGGSTLYARFYRKVEQGKALIINKMRQEPEVTFTGAMVFPIIHRAEVMDISVKTIEIDRRGKEGLICKDNIRADIKVTFFVRVNKTADDVLKVAQSIGCARASRPEDARGAVHAPSSPRRSRPSASSSTSRSSTPSATSSRTRSSRSSARTSTATSSTTPPSTTSSRRRSRSLDTHNILDAQGIRKITEITAIAERADQRAAPATSGRRSRSRTSRPTRRSSARAPAGRGRGQADERDRDVAGPRGGRDRRRSQAEERAQVELARIKADEEIAHRRARTSSAQIEVAEKNREREVGVETRARREGPRSSR